MPTLIKERYEMLETLGAGGEARVVKALDRQHDRFVALKIRPVRDDQAREELLSEARILLAVPPHPALPLVREDFFDGDDYVVAMDWVDGTDLATLLRDRGRPGPRAVERAGLSRRRPPRRSRTCTRRRRRSSTATSSPRNLILTNGGRVKLVDFGMSSAPERAAPAHRHPRLSGAGARSRRRAVARERRLRARGDGVRAADRLARRPGVLPTWEGIDPAQAEQLEAAIRLGMATDPARRPATPGELVERLRAGWAEALPTGVVTFCLSDIEGSTAHVGRRSRRRWPRRSCATTS